MFNLYISNKGEKWFGLVSQKLASFGATKPPAQPEDGEEDISRNVGKLSLLNADICPRKVYRIKVTARENRSYCVPSTACDRSPAACMFHIFL
jgi:hypothetical protein